MKAVSVKKSLVKINTAPAVNTQIKSLNPRSPDTKVLGHEPEWEAQPIGNRISRLSAAFSWYNYFYNKKDARDMIVAYLDHNSRKDDVRKLRSVPDSAIRPTEAWLCRMTMMGLELNEKETNQLDTYLTELLATRVAVAAALKIDNSKPNIQDRLREKLSECAGEIDGMFDEFLTTGAKMSADFKPITVIRGKNVAPQLVGQLADIWKRKLAEFDLANKGKDAQLTEGYRHLSKLQMRSAVKFCETVINDCGAYVQIKKVERKPRAVKVVSPEKKAAKFKFQLVFDELKIKSQPASALVDKSEAWLYDTKKRKLIHIVADSHTGSFTIKSNSVIGFNTVETMKKTVRKPAEVVKAIQSAGKPAARKIYKDLTTTETVFNGRGSENLIILKAW